MNFQRLDNRRVLTTGEDAPVFEITKSYGKLNESASALLGVTPGVDFLGFGYDNDSKQYMLYKSSKDEGGKKLSPNSTINSESIYKRLNEGSTYVLGTPIVDGTRTYYPLQEGTNEETTESVDESTGEVTTTSGVRAPLNDEEYTKKYGGADTAAKDEDFL